MSVAPFTSDDKPDDFTMTILNHIDTATQDAIIWGHITFCANLIKDASGNEFVKVVRCRDCKHYKPYRTHQHGMMNRCHDEHGHTHKRDESDFCSRGERREQ